MRKLLIILLIFVSITGKSQLCVISLSSQSNDNKEIQAPAKIIDASSENATVGADLLDNGTFDGDLSGWTAGAGWAYANGGAEHTPGNVATLTQDVTVSYDSIYLVSIYQGSISTSSVSFRLGTLGITASNPWVDIGQTFLKNEFAYIATTAGDNSITLTITPSTTYDGTIDSIKVRKIQRNTIEGGIEFYRGDTLSGNFYIDPLHENFCFGFNVGNNLYPVEYTSVNGIKYYGGGYNTFAGVNSGKYNSTGMRNSFYGRNAGMWNISGVKNTYIGENVAWQNKTGYHNTVVGFDALASSTSVVNSVAIGIDALYASISNYRNTAIGSFAFGLLQGGNDNVGVGYNAGYDGVALTVNRCTFLGAGAKADFNGATNSIAIGNSAISTKNNQTVIGNATTTRFEPQGKLVMAQITAALTDGAPTDAEIDAATGLVPATAGAGWQCTIKDSDGTGLLYKIESDGTDWFYTAMTKAL